MAKAFSVGIVVVGLLTSLTGCLAGGPAPDRSDFDSDFGAAFMRGIVGEIPDMDNGTSLTRWTDETSIQFAGDVPHQTRDSTVFVNVRIANTHLFEIGQEITQEGLHDTWTASEAEGPVVDVYVCPNGEGVSGFADRISVTRTGPESFAFRATSTVIEQNLNVDLEFLTP